MKQVAVQWLQVEKWSPELISVRGKETGLCPVSHESLYQSIWACKHGNKSAHRPAIVHSRKRLGNIEVDLMMGKNAVSQSFRRILHKAKYPLHTLTFDNEKAFAEHQAIGQALGLKTYFTRPYTIQDKGTVENRIGQIRRFLPQKTDLREISHHRDRRVEEFLNNRPVRKFKTKHLNKQAKIAQIT